MKSQTNQVKRTKQAKQKQTVSTTTDKSKRTSTRTRTKANTNPNTSANGAIPSPSTSTSQHTTHPNLMLEFTDMLTSRQQQAGMELTYNGRSRRYEVSYDTKITKIPDSISPSVTEIRRICNVLLSGTYVASASRSEEDNTLMLRTDTDAPHHANNYSVRVQMQNPITGYWVKVDTETGRIIAHKKTPGSYKQIRIREYSIADDSHNKQQQQ